jgi:phytoene desaturase
MNHRVRDDATAAVIGSGFGGLAAAIRLQAAGVQTTIFEALEQPGGRARSFSADGHHFDAGPTVITALEALDELFALGDTTLTERVPLLPVEPFYRLRWSDGDSFDYSGDLDHTFEQIRERSPADVEGYRRFLEFSRKNFDTGYRQLVAEPFSRVWDMVRVAPRMLSLRSDRPVYQAVARFIRDEHLRQAMSFHTLLIGGNPFETSSIYTLIHAVEREWGVHFPKGGTVTLVRALVSLFEELGGELRCGDPVARIQLQNGGRPRAVLDTAGGPGGTFDAVVSNADLHHTYRTLLAGEPRALRMARRLERMAWSMSLFVLYFGTRRKYPGLTQHTILFGPRYKELMDEIFHGKTLPEDFSLYLHAPSVTDPDLAPPGGETFYVLSPVPHLGNAAVDWEREAPRYADAILESLEGLLPDLRANLVTRSWFSPRDFQTTLGAYQGNGFSVSPLLTQSAYLRPHNRDPHLPGLYLAGAGTHPGAGLPGVVNSGKATARLVLQDLGFA